MNDAARAARNAYQREWAKKNPEKVKSYRDRYWEKKAAEAVNKAAQIDATGEKTGK